MSRRRRSRDVDVFIRIAGLQFGIVSEIFGCILVGMLYTEGLHFESHDACQIRFGIHIVEDFELQMVVQVVDSIVSVSVSASDEETSRIELHLIVIVSVRNGRGQRQVVQNPVTITHTISAMAMGQGFLHRGSVVIVDA